MSEFLGKIGAVSLSDKDFCTLRHGNSCKFGYLESTLSYYLSIERTVYENGLAHLLLFLLIEKVAASCGKFGLDLVVYLLVNDG
ncbi:MAG: hypothetical protein BWZ04_02986 [Firmicutes bacterium ADurb.BinA205]|nr:MAG: hypothetical protein BWZ04_02986 [Firmicutes bacterium ADurb.BinA205]